MRMAATEPMMRLVLALVVMDAAACVDPPAPPLDPVRIGMLSPRSGALRDLAPAWESAALLAAELVNAGGGLMEGRQLELVVRDSETNPEAAVAAGRALVEDGVVGIVGPATSGEASTVLAEVAIPNAVPMVSCCATAASLTGGNQPNNGYFFRTTPSDELQGKALAYLASSGYSAPTENASSGTPFFVDACPEVVFVHRNDAYGRGFLTVFQAEYPNDIALTVAYGAATQEASRDELTAAVNQVVDHLTVPARPIDVCIVVISFVDDGSAIVSRTDAALQSALGNDPSQLKYRFLVGDGANSADFAAAVANAAPRIVGTVPFRAPDADAAWTSFRSAWFARFPEAGEPVPYTAQSFDAVMTLALAAVQAETAESRAVRDALFAVTRGGEKLTGRFFGDVAAAIRRGEDVDYDGPSGAVDYDAFGDVIGDYMLWQVETTAQGAAIVERSPLPATAFQR